MKQQTVTVELTKKERHALLSMVLEWDCDWKPDWEVQIGNDTWTRNDIGPLLKKLRDAK